MEIEKLIFTGEKRGENTIIRTGLSFNAKNSDSLLRMLAVVTLAEKYGVEIGQEIESGFEAAGLISYKFAVPNSVIPGYIRKTTETEIDWLNDTREKISPDAFLVEMDSLYKSFYNQLGKND